ncbi:MFS transporter, DHA2 family, multidrug resistance protein [Tistlia consotensis]|uniref:MFS transporter, DHA2 family, multidrug resistance protein n=1 Tax=Tistlia consotensis USBA 355 TaxID=560819 RepID=A0A1Y6BSL2_9PROT|nr:DHA2 family efflux MFS transporter permease subunit [Tistlia consotensis]SMF16015.1 MFS transporter, DHA2 family, multidrug resistance protein [Tistlia consotensis USBA 355]SNR41512.1 MFS transporter, DHA2 family, multidrug resistance protein [Tistlia consotensis]
MSGDDVAARARAGTATWAGFAMMCLGMFMAILDVQVVATSIPAIQRALDVSPDRISWIQTAYLTAEVVAIPLTGLLTRILTMRWLFVASLSLFTLASLGCAASGSFAELLSWRIVQGLAGGTLIPAVFSAVFLLFPVRRQGLATTLAGVLAVLAPTVGPIVGGWITSTWSWHWLFLINVAPGLVTAAAASLLLPRERPQPGVLRQLDPLGLAALALALSALEIGLKQAPDDGWLAAPVLGLLALALLALAGFVLRSLRRARPVVELTTLGERSFALGCLLSFVLGIGLFGSVYLMPVFLGFVRGHDALEIGEIMLVTGIAQLATAPLAVALERRLDPRLLTGAGFLVFATGLGLSAFQTAETDFDQMFWPQVLRGVAVMFCLLPPTRIALGGLAPERVPDASGLFNLMRNLGGAIGLALIDTVIYGRAPHHAAAIVERLRQGDLDTARALGLPLDQVKALAGGPIPPMVQAMVQPLVERLALVRSINEAWALAALLTALALLTVPFARPRRDPGA